MVEICRGRGRVGSMNSPRMRRVDPHTNSAGEQPGSSLQAVRKPRSVKGRCSIQCGDVVWALKKFLSCRCKRSTMPLACGW